MFTVDRQLFVPVLFDMWLYTLEICAAQLRSVTEIAPKSPFLHVNRGPIQYGFRAGATEVIPGAPNVNFLKISVGKTIWEAVKKSSKHLKSSKLTCASFQHNWMGGYRFEHNIQNLIWKVTDHGKFFSDLKFTVEALVFHNDSFPLSRENQLILSCLHSFETLQISLIFYGKIC